uniref:hypothetical protein n=1 Tax=Shewanella algae TaxID=38313 RepID=UPI0031F5469A
ITVAETCGNFLARYGILWKPFRLFPATDTASRKCSSIRISYLESKIIGAPLKADVWNLRCKKDELLKLQKELAGKLKQNEQKSSLGLVLKEIDEICKKYK